MSDIAQHPRISDVLNWDVITGVFDLPETTPRVPLDQTLYELPHSSGMHFRRDGSDGVTHRQAATVLHALVEVIRDRDNMGADTRSYVASLFSHIVELASTGPAAQQIPEGGV